MKTKIITVIMCLTTIEVHAAKLCANIGIHSSCNLPTSNGLHDWGAHCGGSTGIDITGIAACGPLAKYGYTTDKITQLGTTCYCRMIYPGISKWVSLGDYVQYNTDIQCLQNCASKCPQYIEVDEDHNIKSSLFQNLR